MKTTLYMVFVITIILLPGCILFEDNSWIYGSWIQTQNPIPTSSVFRFHSNETWTEYDDYEETLVLDSGTYDINGSFILLNGVPLGFEKVDNDHFQLIFIGVQDYYRKSKYPVGSIIDTPITVNSGWEITTIAEYAFFHFSFAATDGVNYTIQWDDNWEGSGSYTADVMVTAYKSNLKDAYFRDIDSGYDFPQEFTATESGTVYIELYAYEGGTVAIQVTSP